MSNYRHRGTKIYPLLDGGRIQIADKSIFAVSRNKITADGETFTLKAATIKQVIENSIELDHDSKLYPNIALPCTSKDVARLYTFYNKKLFNNECPPLKDVQITSVRGNRRQYADATPMSKGSGVSFRLRFSDKSMTNVEFFCNVVIHEMIHILHQKRYYLDNNEDYYRASHGPRFLEDMKRVNSLGYKVTVTADIDNDVVGKLQHAKHAMVVSALNMELAFYSNETIDSAKLLSKLRSGGFSPTRYYVGTSEDAKFPSYAVKLTSKGTFIGTVRSLPTQEIGFFKSFVKVEKETALEVPKAAQAAIYAARKCIYYRWTDYYSLVTRTAGINEASLHEGDATYDYIRETWLSITDQDIKKSVPLKELYDEIVPQDMPDERVIRVLSYAYDMYFKERCTKERYADLCVSKFDIVTLSGKEFKKQLLVKLE